MSVVNFSALYIPDPAKGRPVFNGQIYIGLPDLDPKIPANQKDVYYVLETGSLVLAQQPILTSAGGVPVYNGSYVTLDVSGNYSMRVDDSKGVQVYYLPNNVPGSDSNGTIISINDPETLADAQLIVNFSSASMSGAAIYIGKDSGDRGRLFPVKDYNVTGDQQITLTQSYPAGTICLAVVSEYTNIAAGYVKKSSTLESAISDSSLVEFDTIEVKERVSGIGGGGIWDVVLASGVVTNTYNIVQCSGVPLLALVLREDKAVYASQYTDDISDIGLAWNFADAHANAMGWPFFVPAGSYSSSIGLTWDGIFHDIIGAGVDICKITFTEDVQGIRFRGGRIEGIQFIGIGALSTQVGMLMEQNQRHSLNRVKCTKFNSGFKFSGGNLSSFDNVFGIENNQHGFVADMDTPDNNSITVGMMDLKGNGINGLEFTNGTPSNVSQQWKGGVISCQSNGGKGFNISGRGHELTFYDEFNGLLSLLDATCNASQIRMLFGQVTDNGSQNDVISHRQGATEAISHSNLETKALRVRDRDFAGQFNQLQTANNKLVISESGSTSPSILEIRSDLGDALNVRVNGAVNGQVITNTDNSALILPANGNVMQVSNSLATTITSITAPAIGLEFTLIFLDGNSTVQNNTNIKLSGGVDFVATINDTLKLTYDGSKYYQSGGSVN